MTRRSIPRRGAWLLAGLLLATPALAHKLRLFAAAEADLITGSAYFAGGGPATGSRVRVQDADGQTLAELTPDAQGRFSYRAQAATDLTLVADTGDGHRVTWHIPAAELAGAFPTAASAARTAEAAPVAAVPAFTAPSEAATTPVCPPAVSPAPSEAAIERAVARQVHPLREEILAYQDQARLRDILGGIGYLFGLMGLALWWHARRAGRSP
jgi:nickel transport protein